ncbi:MAG: TIGR03435 family protein [Vicinamibacterales bacterium]
MVRVLAVTLVLAGLLLAEPLAQGLVEVASVRRHPPAENVQWMIAPEPGGRLRLRLTAERLVAVAFRLQLDQVVNAPGWARSDMYDMLVKLRDGGKVNIDTVGPIAREIAADRFAIKTHEETRERPVYLLVRSRPDRVPGSRLKPALVDCTLRGPAPGTPGQPAPAAAVSRCGLTQRPGVISMSGFPVDAFIRVLSNLVGRVVVNRSGLEGNWDLELEFAPDLSSDGVGSGTDRPSIFAALTEQLGLKLEAGRAPVSVVAIDEIRRPAED